MKLSKVLTSILLCCFLIACNDDKSNEPKAKEARRADPKPEDFIVNIPKEPLVEMSKAPLESIHARNLILIIGKKKIEITNIGISYTKYPKYTALNDFIKVTDSNRSYYLSRRSGRAFGSVAKDPNPTFDNEKNWNVGELGSLYIAHERDFEAALKKVEGPIPTRTIALNQEKWLQNSEIETNFLLSKCKGMNGWEELKENVGNLPTLGTVQVDGFFFFDSLRVTTRYGIIINVNEGTFLGLRYNPTSHIKGYGVYAGICDKCNYFYKNALERNYLYGYYKTCHNLYSRQYKLPESLKSRKDILPTYNQQFEDTVIKRYSENFNSYTKAEAFLDYSDTDNLFEKLPTEENLNFDELYYLQTNNLQPYSPQEP